jgi:hypothetical protein
VVRNNRLRLSQPGSAEIAFNAMIRVRVVILKELELWMRDFSILLNKPKEEIFIQVMEVRQCLLTAF